MLREEQIDIRRQRAKAGKFQIENLGKNRVFSDYRVTNPESGGQYEVHVRGFEVGDNTCTCPDFKANTLGTCKHIEAVLDTKVAAVACHESRLGGDPAIVSQLLEHRAAEEGARAGIAHAEAFRRLRLR